MLGNIWWLPIGVFLIALCSSLCQVTASSMDLEEFREFRESEFHLNISFVLQKRRLYRSAPLIRPGPVFGTEKKVPFKRNILTF